MATEYTWFVGPLDSHTNEVIGKELSSDDHDQERQEWCQTTIGKRQLWRCEHSFITKLKNNRHHSHLKFEIFVRQGRGKIRPFKPRKKLPKGAIKHASAMV